jgi:hypothetical protein
MRIMHVLLAAFAFGTGVPAVVMGQSVSKSETWHPEADSAPPVLLDRESAMPGDLVIGGDPLRGGGAACEDIGGYTQVFANPNRYRGAAYRIESTAQLNEFSVELNFTGSVNLYYTVHSRPANTTQPFEKVWPAPADPQFRTIVGAGRAFYSSGPMEDDDLEVAGFRLEAGFEYTLGVAWGASNVAYAYDGPSYPRPFSKGQVLGGTALSNVTPPISDSIVLNSPPGSGIFSGGAYSSRLCFAADPGACCIGGPEGCQFLTEDECNFMNGEWTAAQVTCAETGDCAALPSGACCTAGDQCTAFNIFFCEANGGTFHIGETCVPDFCTPRGACCFNGSCTDALTEDQCLAQGMDAVYRGDETDCGSVSPCNAGACCYGGECFVQSSLQCSAFGGAYGGDLTTCGPNPCEVTGACCLGAAGGTCQDLTSAACASQGGNFRGNGTVCGEEEPLCGRGACCTTTGCIGPVTQSLCNVGLAGTWRGDGTACDTIDPHCPGTCCWNGGNSCNGAGGVRLSPEDCAQLPGGVFMGYDVSCPSGMNPPSTLCAGTAPNGACCLPGGECALVDDGDACDAISGAYQGDGSTCNEGCPSCVSAADCFDGNACTMDVCNEGVCMNPTMPCDDGLDCTADSCVGGFCVHTLDCSDGVACTTDACGPGGACIHTPNNNACNDGNPCTSGTCDAMTGCVQTNIMGGCTDNDECTVGDACMDGQCVPGTPADCDDGVECTEDLCNPTIGCVNNPVDQGCDDGNPCTDDVCDSVLGCFNTDNTAACDDGDLCTVNDVCSAGTCAGVVNTCDDGFDCTIDSCDPETGDCLNVVDPLACDDGNPCTVDTCEAGVCQNTVLDEGTACDDGDNCTTGETCVVGVCTPADTVVCDDGIECTVDTCDAEGECVFTPDDAPCQGTNECRTYFCDVVLGCTNFENTNPCDDEDPCTTDDVCSNGECSGTFVDCDDQDECTADECVDGECVHTPIPCGGACCLASVCSDVANEAECLAQSYVCDLEALLPPSFTGCYGDADGNGAVNAGDRGFISAAIGASMPDLVCQFDMDGNGFVNAADRGFVSASIGLCGPLPNYMNGSGLNSAGDGPDSRFPRGTYAGNGTSCATTTCD